MACSALVFLVFPTFVLGAYTSDSSTIQFAQGILLIAGLFQLSDGAQAVASGALRGMGQLRETATAHLVGHWLVGLPIALWLGVYGTLRLQGLWIGLSAGLTFVAITLIWRWRVATQREIQRVI
jgi:MATE family multidrug resistance protein